MKMSRFCRKNAIPCHQWASLVREVGKTVGLGTGLLATMKPAVTLCDELWAGGLRISSTAEGIEVQFISVTNGYQ